MLLQMQNDIKIDALVVIGDIGYDLDTNNGLNY